MRWPAAVLLFLLLLAPAATAAVVDHAADLGTAWNTQRKLVQAPDGTLYAAVLTRNATGSGHVVFVRSTDAGHTWGRLPLPFPGTVETLRPTLAVAANGDLWAAWTQYIPADEHLQVKAARWDGAGWHDLIQISHTDGYSGYPGMAIDSRGNIHLAWYGLQGEGYRIFYRERLTNGTWTPAIYFAVGHPDAVNPDVVVGPGDQVHIVWYKLEQPVWRIYYVTRVPGGPWTSPRYLSQASSNAADPNEVVLPSGNLLVTWNAADSAGTPSVWATVVRGTPGNVTTTTPRPISPPGTTATLPSMTLDPRGGVLAAWATPAGIQVWHLTTNGTRQALLGTVGNPGADYPSMSQDTPAKGLAQLLFTDRLADGSYRVAYALVTAAGTVKEIRTTPGIDVVAALPAIVGSLEAAAAAGLAGLAFIGVRATRRRR